MSQTIDTPLNHHLWKNGNVWWVAYTVHLPGWKKTRFRQSLGTTDLEEARRRRDVLFYLWGKSGDAKLSLRFQAPRASREDAA
jgi:hypothetical protein